MTREEALNDWLPIIRQMVKGTEVYEKALDMAIKALEQEPCDDCVSRQDLREPRFIIAENDYQKGWNDALKSVYENAPSIQPQPKMGRWEWNQYDANPKIGNFHCSLCHSIGRTYFDYCPYCGAKMSEIPTGAEWGRMNENS